MSFKLNSNKSFLTVLFIFLAYLVSAQAIVSTENVTASEIPLASSALELRSNSLGFLPPRMTIAQIEAISSPAEGLLVFCVDCVPKMPFYYDGTNFVSIGDSNVIIEGNGGGGGNTGEDGTEIVDVVTLTGRTWMDRNLGATRQATASNDHLAYGNHYQWGRLRDGHELINWTSSTEGTPQNDQTTSNIATGSDPGTTDFILRDLSVDGNWTTFAERGTLWRDVNLGAKGANDPCPAGYRVPSQTEWGLERDQWEPIGTSGAYASPLNLPAAGRRGNTGSASVSDAGTTIYYWSSSVSGSSPNRSVALIEDNTFISGLNTAFRTVGASVRCIKEE